MLSIASRIPKKRSTETTLQPILPLIPKILPQSDEEKSMYISLELKNKAGDRASNSHNSYKKYVRKFEEGTPEQWVMLMRDIEEIWTQNSISRGPDRAATVRSLLRGESLHAFNAALDESTRAGQADGEGENQEGAARRELPITIEMVQSALDSVAKEVFPHRALELQKLWMTRGMKKPFELTTRKMASAITRINNALPLFPDAQESDKFTNREIVGLIEWALPKTWRQKFDLDGYVPTLHPKAKLIESCEAIERNQEVKDLKSKKDNKPSPKRENGKTVRSPKKSEKKSHHCKLHGWNLTHDTDNCWTLNKQACDNGKKNGEDQKPKKFSNRSFKKELNLLAKSSSKEKVLEQYSTLIAKEQARLRALKKRQREAVNEESDSDMSVQVVEPKKKTKKVKFDEPTPEEKAFLKRIKKGSEESAESGEESDTSEDSD